MPLRVHQRIESAEFLVGSSPKKTPPSFFRNPCGHRKQPLGGRKKKIPPPVVGVEEMGVIENTAGFQLGIHINQREPRDPCLHRRSVCRGQGLDGSAKGGAIKTSQSYDRNTENIRTDLPLDRTAASPSGEMNDIRLHPVLFHPLKSIGHTQGYPLHHRSGHIIRTRIGSRHPIQNPTGSREIRGPLSLQ